MKVSIIIPVYNKAEYISDCLESLLQQDFDSFEIIAVDDGSTDDSGRICDKKASQDSRIRVIHTENGGVTAARRIGVEHAKGRYIVFADADDELMPDALNILYKAIEESGADEVIGRYQSFSGATSPVVHRGLATDVKPFMRDIVAGKNRFPILWALIFRKELLNECLNAPRDIVEGEDQLMQLRILVKQPKVFFIDNCVYRYNVGLPNSRRHTLQRAMHYDELLREILAPMWNDMQPYYVLRQIKEYERFMTEGQRSVRKEYYADAITHVPSHLPLFHRIAWQLPECMVSPAVRFYQFVIKTKQRGL